MNSKLKENYKSELRLISKIAKRAKEEVFNMVDSVTVMDLIMDIEYTHESNPLRLNDLLEADKGNFGHDVVGIYHHFDRTTKKLTDCFSPRYSL